jgi:SHS2 domain-containing protein
MEDIAIADAAFEAWGRSGEEMFQAAADALLNVMVAEPETVLESEEVQIRLENKELEMLLFDFLGELVFFKDSRLLLLHIKSAAITLIDGNYTLTAVARGERIDPSRHPLAVDVKAVTLYRLKVEKTEEEWRCNVVLDI